MKIINIENNNYPEQLRKINKPPKKLYVLGDEKILSNKCIAIVGSRNCTEYGKKEALRFAQELTLQGLQITSGLAIGIDTFAHTGCLNEDGKTIAVLGCGFNHLYPKENRELFNKIINNGGAIVSEYAPILEPSSDKFRQRNRIVCGLSIATLIIEAAARSGTSITARYTMEQEKPVFCIPNSLENNKGVGTNELLKNGALLATSVDDILQKCNLPKINLDNLPKENKRINKNLKKVKEKIVKEKPIKINKEYKDIYNILTDKPTNPNEICKALKQNISEINSKLLLMEMEGIIKKVAGNSYIRI